ncbi:hypothetical protein BaRGS_00018586 [Batillaria attramentaria]|uniref:tRNA (adenine(58)-N(1))-methyltransferase catalytic subunit TRMT61A n=1 Tax=Batillaria attramentaria TaxID=370345 RepID=A0ABD0KSK4_9CAEN
MSFSGSKTLMEEGDTVLLYLGYDNIVQLQLARGRVHQTRYGAIKHEHLIGAPYGAKVDCPKGWVYPLQPTAELWTLALPHRTQILYTPDISLIVLQLHLKPGAVVVEAGTGSGSLSHALIRSVMPSGHLHTFEFHAERCAAARAEFEQHGLGDYVTARHRDVCAQGFELEHVADAVFLDLPAPWECINSAKQALRQGGRICTFSPCMEQVQRTCEELCKHGFEDLSTVECLARNFSVQSVRMAPIDFGDSQDQKGDTQASHSSKISKTDLPSSQGKADESEMETEQQDSETRTAAENVGDTLVRAETQYAQPNSKATNQSGTRSKGAEFKSAAPPNVMQGHTGFLTFASLY